MIRNNLRLTLRRFSQQKLNTSLHLVGLSIGITVCLLIGLFLRHELSFDNYHTKADRIYRVNSMWTMVDKESFHFSTPMPMAASLRLDIPELEKVVQVHPMRTSIVEINPEKRFLEDRILLAEPEILEVFDIEIIKGNGKDALTKPNHALLTQSTAKKYFGGEDPIGKTFKFNNAHAITVAGVIRDLPGNTHLPASMLMSFVRDIKFLGTEPETWTNVSGTSTFIVLPKTINPESMVSRLRAMADKNINSRPDMPANFRNDFALQPLHTIHLETKWGAGGPWIKAINPTWLWFFASIGIAVLILACINFVNLSTAQALTRAKEVGVRKSVGAGRNQLIGQFLLETWLLTLISGVLAIVIAKTSLPAINNMLDKHISFDLLQSPGLLLALFTGIILTGLLAGLYPAWIISKFNPVIVLKTGSAGAGNQRSAWLRKTLVITQFTISVGLLIGLWLIAQQVKYLRNKNLGFDKDNIVSVELKDADKAIPLSSELNKIPQLKDFAFATATPINEGHWGSIMSLTNGDDPARQDVTMIFGDVHYCSMYGLRLLSGRLPVSSDTNYISNSIPKEKQITKVVVNEKLIQALGLGTAETAVGKRFWFGMGSGNAEVIGVVADFNTQSLHEPIQPTLISQFPKEYSQAGIKIKAGSDFPKTISMIEASWKKMFPDEIFTFKFLDDQIEAFYSAETRLYDLFKIFAGLAMLISCLGLWGLATYTAQQRTKEIGIRKVLGASVSGIVTLLSKDFLKLVAFSLLIATPLSWYFINRWLQDFAYRININWWVFVAGGTIAVLIAFLTVSYQAVKAANANPVKNLRTE